MLNHRFRSPIAAALQGYPPGVAKLALALALSALVVFVASRMIAMARVEARST